ncbi:MAG: hypothetical protein AAFV53_38920 [Myxococcota bacterium]
MKKSRSADAAWDLDQAEESRRRRARSGGIRFQSVKAALGWYFEMQGKLGSPQSMHPRTQTAPGGAQVYVRVDGGRGGDLDEVLATMATIGKALERLHRVFPMGHRILVGVYQEGRTGQLLSEELEVSASNVSRFRGKAEFFLAGAVTSVIDF